MTTATQHLPRPSLARIYALEVGYETLRMLRTPGFALPTLLFPAMFYVFFALMFNHGADAATYLLATYGVFGVMGPALFGFGVGLATERGMGWLKQKQVAPMPLPAYFLAKIVMCAGFALLITLSLCALGAVLGDVRLAHGTWLLLILTLVLGTLPFVAIGLAFGAHLKAQAAPAVMNLTYLPMAFLSGLWVPVQMLPHVLQQIAVWLPPYHLAQIALAVVGKAPASDVPIHLLALGAYSALALAIAARGLRRDTQH